MIATFSVLELKSSPHGVVGKVTTPEGQLYLPFFTSPKPEGAARPLREITNLHLLRSVKK